MVHYLRAISPTKSLVLYKYDYYLSSSMLFSNPSVLNSRGKIIIIIISNLDALVASTKLLYAESG